MIAWALALALQPGSTPLEDNPHYLRAVAAWDDERWYDAATEFVAAYELDPRPEYVFAEARAHQLGGDCVAAVPAYRRFIALTPPPQAIEDAEAGIRACEARITDAPAPPPSTTVAAPPPRTAPAPTPVARDPIGHALLWPGVVTASAGAGLLADAHLRRGRAADGDEQDYRDTLRPAPALSRAGIAALSIGGALIVAGIVRFVAAHRRRSRGARVTLGPRSLGLVSGPTLVAPSRITAAMEMRW